MMKAYLILLRTPALDLATKTKIHQILKEKGFDTNKIIRQ
jgi:lipocalin